MLFLLSFSYSQLQAQDPLWALSDQQVTFNDDVGNNPFSNSNPLPVITSTNYEPDVSEDIYYFQGDIPIIHQNAQYDQNGELLFFIQDGFIYNKDGYLIAMPHYSYEVVGSGSSTQLIYIENDDDSPECETCTKGMNNPDVLISAVPDFCELFYIIYGSGESEISDEPANGVNYIILDISGDNIHFDNPDILGALLTANTQDDYGLNIPFGIDERTVELYQYYNPALLNRSPLHFMEIIETDDNDEKKLYISNSDKLFQNDLTNNGIVTTNTITLNSCEMLSQGESSNVLAVPFIKSGDLQISYCQNLTKYVVAFVSGASDDSGQFLRIWTINPTTLDLDQEIHCERLGDFVRINGLNFSPNGNGLYLATRIWVVDETGEWPFDYHEEGRLRCRSIDSSSNVSITDVPNVNMDDFYDDELYASRIENNFVDGEEVLLFFGNNGVGQLLNSNIPSIATIDYPIINSSNFNTTRYKAYRICENYSDFISEYLFSVLPKQNYNGTQIQDYLAQDLCCETLLTVTGEPDQSISGTETWTSTNNPFDNSGEPIRVEGEITFLDGADIFISGMTFEFGPHGRFIIDPGAKVRISNNSLLTNACDEMWKGVLVKGTNYVDQIPETGGDQGNLFISGSTIENAQTGVTVNAGGIIKTYASTIFRNNRVGVSMSPYVNGGLNNKSYFRLTDFITDGELISGQSPKYFLHLNSVVGIDIKDCDFRNTAPTLVYNINHRGIGIAAFNSSFNVIDGFSFGQNEFYKLTTGIEAQYTRSVRTFMVDGMTFDRNRTGIFANNNKAGVITNNWIKVPDFVYIEGDFNRAPEGCYMLNSTKYTIEENDFDHLGTNRSRTYGLIVDNSGGAENEVFRNWFYDLDVGFYLKNNNRNGLTQDGLVARCQTFENCRRDMYLAPYSDWRDTHGDYSGDEVDQTNNRFSQAVHSCPTAYNDINVSDQYGEATGALDLMFDYYHLASTDTEPDCESDHMESEIPYGMEFTNLDFVEHCEANIGPGGDTGGGSGGSSGFAAGDGRSNSQLRTDHEDEMANLNDAKMLYNMTVNQGVGVDLMEAINKLNPMASGALRNLLLQKFPLSKEVLKGTINRLEPMDPWHLTQVLLANAPLEKDVMLALDDMQVLSDFFMNYIYNANENSDANIRQLLDMEIKHRSLVKSDIEKILIHRYLHPIPVDEDDNPEPNYAEYYNWLENIDDGWAKKTLIEKAIQDNDVIKCNQLITELCANHPEREDWWNFKLSLLGTTEPTTEQINELWETYQEEGESYGEALTFLHQFGETTEYPLVEDPVDKSFNGASSYKDDKGYDIREIELSVNPNPASDVIYLSYPPEADERSMAQVFDSKGNLIKSIPLLHNGILDIEVKDWTEGLYLLNISADGLDMGSLKFTVIH